MIRVRPIHHTAHPDEWRRLLEALGARLVIENGSWREYDTASGTIAVSAAPDESVLGFTATDLDAVLHRAIEAGVEAARTDEGPAGAIRVTAASGVSFLIDETYRGPLDVPGGPAVLQIWYQSDAAEMRRVYTAMGLRPRIVSDDPGGWADYAAPGGGLAAQHPAADVRVDATAFEYAGDLDALAERVRRAGIEASIIDEAYNRTLLVDSPDGGKVWVNGVQEDLYGYHRAD